ncbi:MAG: replicative DNA helicase [Cyanobacteria bacterium P01_F01_bin.150]
MNMAIEANPAAQKLSGKDIISHLHALGYQKNDNVCLRAFYPSKSEHSDQGRKCNFKYPSLPTQDLAQWSREGRGIYVVVNPGGHKDADIKECRAFFYEHDQLSKEVSTALWSSLGLPEPTLQVDTGGKSVHSYWVLAESCSVGEWRSLQADLLEYADADRSLKNPSRVMRLAGCFHAGTGNPSTIVSASGFRYSYESLRRLVPNADPDEPLFGCLAIQEGPDPKSPKWSEFDRDFSLPIQERVPLDVCISRTNRDLLVQGARDNRNDNGASLARDLIGTSNYLLGIGQRYDGDPYSLFIEYCRKCSSDDWAQREWDSIWKSAQGSRPGPSLKPELIESCVKGWQWRRLKLMGTEIVKSLPKVTGSVDLDEAPEGATDEQRLRVAITNYNKVCDAGNLFQSIPLKNQIARDWSLSKSEVEALARRLSREESEGLSPVGDVITNVFQEMEERSISGATSGVKVGYRELDFMTQGYQNSSLIITAARPSVGKTSFVINQARNIAVDQGLPVIVFSIEMSKEQLVYRLLSSEAEIVNTTLKSGRLSDMESNRLYSAVDRLMDAPIYFEDTGEIRVDEIRQRLRTFTSQTGQKIGMVVIDYLQIMGGIDGDVVNDLARITRQLKTIARDFNCPINVLSQLSRGVEGRNDKRPVSADLRSSGAIEQDADLIMMIYRDEMHNKESLDKGVAEVIITKHRNGPLGTVRLSFDGQYTKFKDLVS